LYIRAASLYIREGHLYIYNNITSLSITYKQARFITMMLFKPFVLIAVALSAFQAQAAPTHSHIQNDLMKMSEQASTFNAAVKALPGPRAMDKKIAVCCSR
jgi:hypothetical protein